MSVNSSQEIQAPLSVGAESAIIESIAGVAPGFSCSALDFRLSRDSSLQSNLFRCPAGILANSTYPADFIADNIMIQTNLIDSAYK